MIGEITVATVCMNVEHDAKKNLEKYVKFIHQAAKKNARLIVFPEQSLQGYLYNLASWRAETIEYQYAYAEEIPEGKSTKKLIQKAIEKNMYIVWGMTEKAPKEGTGILYNTAVLVGPEGYIGKYRKVHQPLDESHLFFSGDLFEVFETEIGKIGLLICYDKAFPESCRELTLQGADILVMPTAWPLSKPGGDPDPESDHMTYKYDLFDKVRALENSCWFISSNQIGRSGDHDYLGKSRIVAPNGKVISEVGYEEALVTSVINVTESICKAMTIDFLGLNLRKDRRPEIYRHISKIKKPYKEAFLI